MSFDRGADIFVDSKDPESIKAASNTCDIILNTVSAEHQVMDYVPLLNYNGVIVQLGLVKDPHALPQIPLMFRRNTVTGSHIGGIKATEECLELCAKHGILPDVQHIKASEIDWAWNELVTQNPDGIRYVIDVKKSLEDKEFMPKA